MDKCPKCGNSNIKLINYLGIKTIKCKNCGFDESLLLNVFPEQKTNQKAKGEYSVYKSGGSQRARKK